MSENTTAKKTGVDKLIDGIEKVCNKLPPPAILFCWLFLITAIIGCIFSVMGVALTNPASGEVVTSANLFSKDGVDWILGNMVKNFTGFAPLGLVITMTLGIGLCEESGMLISMLNSSLKNVPAYLQSRMKISLKQLLQRQKSLMHRPRKTQPKSMRQSTESIP